MLPSAQASVAMAPEELSFAAALYGPAVLHQGQAQGEAVSPGAQGSGGEGGYSSPPRVGLYGAAGATGGYTQQQPQLYGAPGAGATQPAYEGQGGDGAAHTSLTFPRHYPQHQEQFAQQQPQQQPQVVQQGGQQGPGPGADWPLDQTRFFDPQQLAQLRQAEQERQESASLASVLATAAVEHARTAMAAVPLLSAQRSPSPPDIRYLGVAVQDNVHIRGRSAGATEGAKPQQIHSCSCTLLPHQLACATATLLRQ